MKLLFGQDARVAEWVSSKIPHMHGHGFGQCTAIGVLNSKSELVGGCCFHDWRERFRTLEWSAAATDPRWLTPKIISGIMAYPFAQLQCRKIRAIIPRKNIRAREFHTRFGFKQEGCLRREYGGDDAIPYGMLLSEWKRSPFNIDHVSPESSATTSVGVH